MRGRIKKKTVDKYKRRIRDVVIKGLGKPVLVYKQPIKSECPNCYYDKLTDKSTGTCKWTLSEALQKQQEYEVAGGIGLRYKYFAKGRCPICKGFGYITVARKLWINCKITWDPSSRGFDNQTVYTSAGSDGALVIELKTHPKYFDIFKNSDKLIIDDVECKMSRAPIVRGLGNKSIMVITAFTTDKPKIDRNERINTYG